MQRSASSSPGARPPPPTAAAAPTDIVYVTAWSGAVALLTTMANVDEPAVVGRPLMTPVAERPRPAGSAPDVTVYVGAGEPLAVTAWV